MASTDARPVPRKNVAYRVTFPILDADGDLVTAAASPDSEVSIDGGTFTDCTNEATEIATSSGVYYLDLTSSEMNGDTVAVIVKTATSGAKTTVLVFYPEEAGDYRADVTHFGGTAGTFSGGRAEVNASHISGSAVSTTTAQIGVNVVQISADATAADNAEAFFDGTGYAGTGNTIPTVTTVTNAVSANVTQISGDTTAADNCEAFFDGTGYAGTNNVIPTVTTATNVTTVNGLAANVVTAAALAADAVTEIQSGLATAAALADVQTDTNDIQTRLPAALVSGRIDASVGALEADTLTASALAADAVAEIADAVWDEDATGHQTQGTFGQAIGDPAADASTIWDLVNTNLDATVGSRAAQTTADAIEADTQDLQSRVPAALVSGRIDASVGAMAANVITAAATASDFGAEVADAVWDEATSGHATAGTTGAALTAAGGAGDPWSTALPGAYSAGTAGNIIGAQLLRPTVAGRTLDVSTGGEAGIDWANVGSPTSAVTLSGTSVASTTAIAAGGLSADAITDAAVDKINDDVIEGTITLRGAVRLMLSALVGRLSGAAAGTPTFRDTSNTKNRIVAATTEDGRTSVTLDPS